MKRPLCLAALIITAIVYLYLELFVSEHLTDYSDTEDGKNIQVVGFVDKKEYRVDYNGETSPVIYIIPIGKRDLGNNKYIQCYMSKEDYKEPEIGQKISVSGTKKSFQSPRNYGEFDSRLYYSTLKIAYRIKNAQIGYTSCSTDLFSEELYRIKYQLESVFDKCLEPGDAAIMKAIVLGDKAFMDEETKQLYKDAGIIHIMAVSGLHISILGMGLYKLLRKVRLPLLPSVVLPIMFMFVYGQMCGMSASSVRAILMFSLRLLAPVLGRTYDLLSALSLVEITLLIEQPLYLYNSGFLFSFGAVLAIGFIMPSIASFIPDKKSNRMKFSDDRESTFVQKINDHLLSGIIVSISILMVTLPVYMSYYYVYPIYSIFLNLIILPLMAPLMLLGILCMTIGCVTSFGIVIPGVMIHIILDFYNVLSRFFSKLPGGKWYLGTAPKWKIIVYITALLVFAITAQTKKKDKTKYIFGFAYMAALFMLLFNPAPDLKISVMDVGQGDGILIRTGKESFLIDGGSTDKNQVGKYTIIPYLYYEGVGSLDAVIVTHEDEDHISGIFEIMDDMEKGGIRIKTLILPDVAKPSRGDNYIRLEQRAKDLGIPVNYIKCGDKIKASFDLYCLNPVENMQTEGANAYSTVLYLKKGSFTALFTGDVEQEGEAHIIKDIAANEDEFSGITVLKVAHHGSRYTSNEKLIDILKPKVALISAGQDNKYGHPHKEVLKRLGKYKTKIYRTDEMGEITVIMNGNSISIDEFLPPL
ncbi:DNA internalization-related competence protein ComEC/Rec2 [Butyrivibrio sp. VCB2006]|uniref:DNA internalization-related competence protein ComEC/Rec2 n=1 Tax=Butyrivibrio sp. VCB2006 TaxID=1280679 RepID=UPI000426A43D|nr:DNA internalization-related competence protein ComEC/Rec2 [Butyrivibrio sp. VCB2006]